jgi:hypothetical protein
MNSGNAARVCSVNEEIETADEPETVERLTMMARPGELPEATLRDTFDHIPLVVAVLVLANVAAAAAIGRGTYNLVRRARGYVEDERSPSTPRGTSMH